MRLLDSDLYAIARQCATGKLDPAIVRWKSGVHACAVICSTGDYPASATKGLVINNIPSETESVVVFHAGTKRTPDGKVVTNGGRVLCVTATGSTAGDARQRANNAAEAVDFQNKHFRRDIGITAAVITGTALTYDDSGVDISEGNAFVEDIKKMVKSTLLPGTSQIGGFGALIDLSATGYPDANQIVVGIDGVGTKIEIADEMNDFRSIGYDVVGMCVNDVLCHCAAPIGFLDYFVSGKLRRPMARQVIESITAACRESNCTLVGGETAEMPGVYGPKQWDIAGCAIAYRSPSWPFLPLSDAIQKDDVLLGLVSSGPHSNGFSLVRKVFAVNRVSYHTPTPWDASRTFGEVLLAPTRLYVAQVLDLMKEGLIKGAAHITGGGITENAIRVLDPKGSVAMHVDATSWPKPEIFNWLAGMGPVQNKEMLRTFNSGIGLVLVVSPENKARVAAALKQKGEKEVYEIGKIVPRVGDELLDYSNLERAFDGARYQKERKRVQVAVLISGAGSNMKALLERASQSASNCEIACVVSNKQDAPGLALAAAAGVPALHIPHTADRVAGERQITQELRRRGVQLICLAGYMRVLSGEFVNAWKGRILNVHPALLPSFKGANAVRDALLFGAKITGCTVHFVDEEVDAGAVVAQAAVNIEEGDTEEKLHDRIREQEHRLFPNAMEQVAHKLLQEGRL